MNQSVDYTIHSSKGGRAAPVSEDYISHNPKQRNEEIAEKPLGHTLPLLSPIHSPNRSPKIGLLTQPHRLQKSPGFFRSKVREIERKWA